jgi:hypothetical protein
MGRNRVVIFKSGEEWERWQLITKSGNNLFNLSNKEPSLREDIRKIIDNLSELEDKFLLSYPVLKEHIRCLGLSKIAKS